MLRIIKKIVLVLCAVAACASVVLYTRATTLAQIDVVYEGESDKSAIHFNSFSKEDFKLELTWKNNKTEVIALDDEYVTSGSFTNEPGPHTVEVTYQGKTVTFQYRITVPEFDNVEIFVNGAQSNNNANDLVYTMVYDGNDHFFDFMNLPEDATVEYEYFVGTGVNKQKIETLDPSEKYPFKDVGSYVVSATLSHDAYGTNYNKKTATLVILPQELKNATIKDTDFEFIGNPVDLGNVPLPVFKDNSGKDVSSLLNEVIKDANGKVIGYKYYDVRYVKVEGGKEVGVTDIVDTGDYKIYVTSKDVVKDASGKEKTANYQFSFSANITVSKYYTITFLQPDGSEIPVKVKAGTAIPTKSIPKVVVPVGQKLMVTNGGWDWNGCGHSVNAPVNSNLMVTAPTEFIKYSITYTYYDGSYKTTRTQSYTVESSADLFSAPLANGEFAGWYDANGNKVEVKPLENPSDLTLTAKYKFTYTVMKPNQLTGMLEAEESYVVDFEPVVNLTQIAKEGYQSIGWKISIPLSDGSEVTRNAIMPYRLTANNVTFIPQYTLLEYNVYFNGNKPDSAASGESVNLPLVTFKYSVENPLILSEDGINYKSEYIPSLKSHTFAGWKDANGKAFYTSEGLTGDIVIYAQWEVARIAVNYDLNGGSATGVVPGEEFDYGSYVVITGKTPTRPGYEFIGWSENPDADYDDDYYVGGDKSYFIDADKDDHPTEITYYAIWKAARLTITYSPDGVGTQNDYWTYNEYESYVLKELFSKNGFTFVGWILANDTTKTLYKAGEAFAITGNTKFIAQWTPNVTFNSNDDLSGPKGTADGNVTGVVSDYPRDTYADGTIILPQNPYTNTLPYMEFIGWSTTKTANRSSSSILAPGAKYQVKGDVTFYAIWAEKQYTVKYQYGYTGKADKTLNKSTTYWGAVITLETPSREGYVIEGWYVNGTKYNAGDKYTVSSDVTFVAKWSPKPHTIVFGDNGADDISVPVENVYGSTAEKIKLPASTYSKDYYKFVGWSTTTTASGLIAKDTNGDQWYEIPAKNNETLYLYAIWEEVEYQLVFNFSGDNTLDNINGTTISYSDFRSGNIKLTYSMMNVAGAYIFGGWYLDEELSIPMDEIEIGMLARDAAETGNKEIVIYAVLDKATDGLIFSSNGKEIIGYNGTDTEVKLPTHYGYTDYRGKVTIAEVTTISYDGPMGAFMYSSITSIIFAENNNITTIKTNAFAGCTNLEMIVIGNGVQTIERYAFAGCSNLATVVIPESVTTIGEKAFYDCENLISVYCEAEADDENLNWHPKWDIIDANDYRSPEVYYGGEW